MHLGRALLAFPISAAVALAAFLAASGLSSLVDATLTATSLPVAVAHAPPPEPPLPVRPSADAILDRNPFESARAPVPRSSDELCDGIRPLVVVASDDPDYAFAALDVGGRRVLRKRGDDVRGMHLLRIGADRVWLEKNGVVCQALLFAAAPAASPPHPARSEIVTATPAGDGGKQSALEKEIASRIVKRGPTEYELDRGTVDRILEAQSELMRSRVVPEKVGDRVVGVRLLGVRPGSVLAMIGLQSGDRLETINGFSVATPTEALEAYARLRVAERLTVRITRNGTPLELDYSIR